MSELWTGWQNFGHTTLLFFPLVNSCIQGRSQGGGQTYNKVENDFKIFKKKWGEKGKTQPHFKQGCILSK